MPPRGVKSAKRARQYEHIKESAVEEGKTEERAKEIAARTVNKQRRESGETPNQRTQGTGKPSARLEDRTRDELENIIGGNSFSELQGLIYFPGQILRVDADSSPNIQCARFIGKRLIFQGRVLISKGCSSSTVMNFRGTSVRLIG